jgi:hypothetical protein
MIVVLSVTEMRWDDLGFLGAGCTVTSAAAAAEQQPLLRPYRDLSVQSIVQGISPDVGRSTIDGLLFMSVTMHACKCSDGSAIATGRTSEDLNGIDIRL